MWKYPVYIGPEGMSNEEMHKHTQVSSSSSTNHSRRTRENLHQKEQSERSEHFENDSSVHDYQRRNKNDNMKSAPYDFRVIVLLCVVFVFIIGLLLGVIVYLSIRKCLF